METTQKLQALNNEINSQVDASLGSLFTKDDVKNVINSLFEKVYDIQNDDVPTSVVDNDAIFEAIKEAIVNETIDITDFTSVEDATFSLDYGNTISLDNYTIDFNHTRFANELIDVVKESLNNNVNA
jgi:hypothetical protein